MASKLEILWCRSFQAVLKIGNVAGIPVVLIIGVIMLVFLNRKAVHDPYIAVITCADAAAEKAATEYLKKNVEKAVIKAKTAQNGAIEMTWEIRLLKQDTEFITALSEMDGVSSAVLVSYNGDYLG